MTYPLPPAFQTDGFDIAAPVTNSDILAELTDTDGILGAARLADGSLMVWDGYSLDITQPGAAQALIAHMIALAAGSTGLRAATPRKAA